MAKPRKLHVGVAHRLALTALGAPLLAPGAAHAESCAVSEFGKETGTLYLAAENALLKERDPAGALTYLEALRTQPLNCYEEGALLRLSAAVNVEVGDYEDAIADLISAMEQGLLPQSETARTLYSLAQLYSSLGDHSASLAYMNRWLEAGGEPERQQQWQIAVLNQKTGNMGEALRWAEQVFEGHGPDADDEVYEFLIYLYGQNDQPEKAASLLSTLQLRIEARAGSPQEDTAK